VKLDKKTILSAVCFIVSFSVSALPCFSQGFQVNLHGQKQISMGGAGTGTSIDAASIVYNPGALVFQKENAVMAGISPLFLRVGFAGLSPSTYKTNFGTTSPPFSAFAAYCLHNKKFKIGLGIYTPFGGSSKWDPSWQGKYLVQDLTLRSLFYQPTVSYQISPRWGFGLGYVLGTGTVDLQRAIPATDIMERDGRARLNGNAVGSGFNAGLFYKPGPDLTLGLSFRSGVHIKTKNGTATFNVPPSLASSFPSPNQYKNTLDLPSTLSLGAGYTPTKKWLVTAEVDLVNWSSYKALKFDYKTQTPLLTNSISPRNYQDSYDLRAGTQFELRPGLFLRAGFTYGATAVKTGYVTPESPDADRIELSAGMGYTVNKRFMIDASFLYVNILKRTQTNLETNFSGTFKTNAYIPGISCAYRF